MKSNYLKDKNILIVDDEKELLNMVKSFLIQDDFTNIYTATNTKEALSLVKENQIDLAILDVMLDKEDGFDLRKDLKNISDFPVIFLTARGEDEDKFKGFGLGADDYIVKPFLPKELLFRVNAILKRSYKDDNPLVKLHSSYIDFEKAIIIKDNKNIPLTAKEYELLQVLYRNKGKIVTIDNICEALWGDNPYGYENSLMAHVRRVREKLENEPSNPVSLLTVKGLGYKLIVEE